VSTAALGLNLLFLRALVGFGVAKIPAQAIAIALVTPVNFIANKLWSFRR
jgi:putative flippase GtrA